MGNGKINDIFGCVITTPEQCMSVLYLDGYGIVVL